MPSSRRSSRGRERTCLLCLLHWQAGSSSLMPLGKSITFTLQEMHIWKGIWITSRNAQTPLGGRAALNPEPRFLPRPVTLQPVRQCPPRFWDPTGCCAVQPSTALPANAPGAESFSSLQLSKDRCELQDGHCPVSPWRRHHKWPKILTTRLRLFRTHTRWM